MSTKRIEDTNQNSAKTMRKNNIWNRLFHKAEVQENIKQMSIYTKQCLEGQRFLDKIESLEG